MEGKKHGSRSQTLLHAAAVKTAATRILWALITAIITAAATAHTAARDVSQPVTITNVSDFKRWVESVTNGQFGHVVLASNLTFDETDSDTLFPLGYNKSDGSCTAWSGTFDGKDHYIDGHAGGNSTEQRTGLFCRLDNANILNVVIGAGWVFSGMSAGGICGIASGNVTFTNVHNHANVSGTFEAGGIVGRSVTNASLVFEYCTNKGTISNQVIKLNFDQYDTAAGGFVGSVYEALQITMVGCNNTGHVQVVFSQDEVFKGYVGGFIGDLNSKNAHIYQNHNEGEVLCQATGEQTECTSGGLIGMEEASISVELCTNKGNIKVEAKTTAIAGGFLGNTRYTNWLNITSCTNEGKVKAITRNSLSDCFVAAAGFIGATEHEILLIYNSSNQGEVTSEASNCTSATSQSGGIVGNAQNYVLKAIDSNNSADVSTKVMVTENAFYSVSMAGGLFGGIGAPSCVIEKCNNVGEVVCQDIGNSAVCIGGGIVGFTLLLESFITEMGTCQNKGNVTIIGGSSHSAGGLVGVWEAFNGPTRLKQVKQDEKYETFININNSANEGAVAATHYPADIGSTSYMVVGGLLGLVSEDMAIVLVNSVNYGRVDGKVAYGIGQKVATATNVVNLGPVNGSETSYALWGSMVQQGDITNVFSDLNACKNCSNVDGSMVIEWDHNQSCFVTIFEDVSAGSSSEFEVGAFADVVLNNGVSQARDVMTMLWDTSLQFVDELDLVFMEPANVRVGVKSTMVGMTVKEIAEQAKINVDDFHVVLNGTLEADEQSSASLELNTSTRVLRSMVLMLCHFVNVSGEVDGVWLVEHGTTAANHQVLSQVFKNTSWVVVNATDGAVVDGSKAVESDWHITVVMAPEPSSSSTTSLLSSLSSSSLVSTPMSSSCSSPSTSDSTPSLDFSEPSYSSSNSSSSEDKGLAAWLVAVIVIASVLAVSVACTVAVLLLIRPRSEPKELDLAELFPTFDGFPTDAVDEEE